jgi:hypothetical protein
MMHGMKSSDAWNAVDSASSRSWPVYRTGLGHPVANALGSVQLRTHVRPSSILWLCQNVGSFGDRIGAHRQSTSPRGIGLTNELGPPASVAVDGKSPRLVNVLSSQPIYFFALANRI